MIQAQYDSLNIALNFLASREKNMQIPLNNLFTKQQIFIEWLPWP